MPQGGNTQFSKGPGDFNMWLLGELLRRGLITGCTNSPDDGNISPAGVKTGLPPRGSIVGVLR